MLVELPVGGRCTATDWCCDFSDVFEESEVGDDGESSDARRRWPAIDVRARACIAVAVFETTRSFGSMDFTIGSALKSNDISEVGVACGMRVLIGLNEYEDI